MNQALLLELTPDSPLIDPYWLHMEVIPEETEEGMTVAMAAGIINDTYGVDGCSGTAGESWQRPEIESPGDVWNMEDAQVLNDDTSLALDRFLTAVDPLAAICRKNSGYDEYAVRIKVFRSHPQTGELYKLQVSNGYASAPIRQRGRVVHTIDINGGTTHTLDNPVGYWPGTKAPVVVWQGFDGPEIKIVGNTLLWDEPVTGTLRAEFDTEWDELTINVHGEPGVSEVVVGTVPEKYLGSGWYSGSEDGSEITDYQDVECSVLAFYHYQYEELILNRPEPDRPDAYQGICHTIVSMGGGDEDGDDPDQEPRCVRRLVEKTVCRCSGESRSRTYTEMVACPEGAFPGTVLGVTRSVGYAGCGESEDVSEWGFYEETCCEEPEFGLPLCRTYRGAYTGGVFTDSDRDELAASYPPGTEFVMVKPADGLCGEYRILQHVAKRPCCEGVIPVSWDAQSSSEWIVPGASCVVFVQNGRGPYTWRVSGRDIWVNSARTRTQMETMEPYAVIHAGPDACGVVSVTVKDGCGSTGGKVKVSAGQWVYVSGGPPGFDGLQTCYSFDHAKGCCPDSDYCDGTHPYECYAPEDCERNEGIYKVVNQPYICTYYCLPCSAPSAYYDDDPVTGIRVATAIKCHKTSDDPCLHKACSMRVEIYEWTC